MREAVQMMKALGDENRFRIFMILANKKMCVCELLQILDIAGSTLSAHLKVLKTAGLIEQKKDGRWIEYGISSDNKRVFELYSLLFESITVDDSQLKADLMFASTLTRESCAAKL